MKSIFFNEKNIGLPPGTPVYIGNRMASAMDITVIVYNHDAAEMQKVSAVEDLQQYQDDKKVLWININGLKDVESIKKVGKLFDIHLLTIEDVLNTEQQPKI